MSTVLAQAFGGVFTAHPLAIAVYWLVALVIGFVGSGLWYRRSAHRTGPGCGARWSPSS